MQIDNEFHIDTALGYNPEYESVHKFGENVSIGNGVYSVIWTAGTTPYPGFIQTASAVRVKAGGNAADTAAGAGARGVTIVGLDQNWNPASETVATAGANASDPTTTRFIRVFRAYLSGVGAYGAANTGAITIETTAGTVVAVISAEIGQTNMCIYSIRAGYKAVLNSLSVMAAANKGVDVRVFQRPNAHTVAAPFGPKRLVMQLYAVTDEHHQFESYPVFAEKTDLWIEASGNGAASSVAATMDLHLISANGQ